jgi:hypothetical protein
MRSFGQSRWPPKGFFGGSSPSGSAEVNWTARTALPSGGFADAINNVGGGRVVLADTSNLLIYTSTDGGHTFALTASGLGEEPVVGARGTGSRWIMGCQATQNYVISTDDGATWPTVATLPAGWGVNAVGANCNNGTGVWLLGSGVGPQLARSADNGVTWTVPATYTPNEWMYITWDGSQFVACVLNASNANALATSPDGLTWTETVFPVPNGERWNWVSFDAMTGLYLVGDSSFNTTEVRSASTALGLTTATSITVPNLQIGITFAMAQGGNLFVFDVNGNVEQSTDGINWTAQVLNMPSGQFCNGGCYDAVNNSYIATSSNGNVSTLP